MLENKLEKQIKDIYEHQRYGRMKMIVVFLAIYFLMIGMVSLFLGNPFSHKGYILFFETWQYGWIYTRPYLIVVCGVTGLMLSLVGISVTVVYDLKKVDKILLQKCDAAVYLEMMEYAVSYGKMLKFKGFQKSVFLLVQQRIVAALIANDKLVETRRFLSVEWCGKKESRLYKSSVMNLELVWAYRHLDVIRYNELFQKAGGEVKKNQIFIAEQLFLEQKYDQTIAVLKDHQKESLYNEVIKTYLLGLSYSRIGDYQKAKICMQYVIENGNTMPQKLWAQERMVGRFIPMLKKVDTGDEN